MAAGQDAKAGNSRDVKGLPRNRPWLLPSNHKLRHLQGLSLRNLDLDKPSSRPRGKTIDDESLPHTLKTPAKALAQKEAAKLEHSKSSSDLKQKAKATVESSFEAKRDSVDVRKDERPLANRLRRRSTLNWATAPPRYRQQRLEGATGGRMADIWFSLHVDGVKEPIYVSEVVEKAMNPSFRYFDMNTYGAFVTRREELVIKFWTKTESTDAYILLVELTVNLKALHFVGKTLESIHHPLPCNAVLFHLSDGIYTSFTDLPADDPISVALTSVKALQHTQSTSSFDALMQLSNLDNCIQDALSTREKLTKQINAILGDQQESREAIDSASRAEDFLSSTNYALSACRRQVQAAQRRRSSLQASLAARRVAIETGQETQTKAQDHLLVSRKDLSTRTQTRQTTKSELSGQIRRIGEDLSKIYPIAPLSDGSLAFTIRGLHLPFASALEEKDPNTISAALGHAAHATHLLSYYLSTPLPYPITLHGSSSTIVDPISISMPSEAARTFPLYQKGAVGYRFEYGVFLLNTNIELLMSRQGARMVDLRYTLGNLKYILTVITEGKGEIPGRKKGQIRALNGSLLGSSRSSSIMSRHGEKRATPLDRTFEASELRKALDESKTQE